MSIHSIKQLYVEGRQTYIIEKVKVAQGLGKDRRIL